MVGPPEDVPQALERNDTLIGGAGLGGERHELGRRRLFDALDRTVGSSGDEPIEAIANEVGYEDAGFFSRLFRRQVKLTPAQYRKRFGSIRRALKTGV